MITLEQAIAHAEEKAEELWQNGGCRCAEEYSQLAGWLKELKALRKLREPTKPIGDLHSVPHYRCAACKCGVKMYEDSVTYPFCHHCGQAIDWSET